MQELCDGCDVVVTHPFNLAAGIAAETLNIPVVVVNPFPSLVRTAHRRPPLDLASDDGVDEEWVTFDAELSVFDRPINAVRIDTGLRPTESAAAMLLFRTARLVLNLAEDWFYPPLPDWPATVLNIGYPYFCPPWSRADEDVQEFIRSGPPPVVVSLGTAMAVDPKNFWNVATDVLMSIGHRGVFVGRGARSTNDDLHAVSFVSLGPVLGASQALVHPGGLGMSYEAARAGIPSLVIPQAFDQFVNARRLCDLGCAIENRWDQLSVDSFEVGLKALFTSETRLRTAELAAECRARLVASSPAVRAVSEIARVRDAFGRSARSGGVRSE
jgi:UDP:flavonoid glycosyltransferase YjiC (YdhE family)